MKNTKLNRFFALTLSVLMVFSFVLTFSGCKNDAENRPEDAVSGYFTAMFKTFDSKDFIDVMSPYRFEANMKSAGIKESEYEDNVKIMMNGIKEQIKTNKMTVKWEIRKAEKLEKDTLSDLKTHYKDTYDVKLQDAKLVTAKATKTIDGKSETTDFEFVVVKLDNKWYVDTAENTQN